MADFFDKVKKGFGKGMTAVSVKSKEMLDANRVNAEIADYERKKKEALAELGTTVYAMLDAGQLDESALGATRGVIAGFDAQISEKQQELARIHAEAKQALKEAEQTMSGTSQASHCTSCGAAITSGAKFCGSCGSQQQT